MFKMPRHVNYEFRSYRKGMLILFLQLALKKKNEMFVKDGKTIHPDTLGKDLPHWYWYFWQHRGALKTGFSKYADLSDTIKALDDIGCDDEEYILLRDCMLLSDAATYARYEERMAAMATMEAEAEKKRTEYNEKKNDFLKYLHETAIPAYTAETGVKITLYFTGGSYCGGSQFIVNFN